MTASARKNVPYLISPSQHPGLGPGQEGGWSSPLCRAPGGPKTRTPGLRLHRGAPRHMITIIALHRYPALGSALRIDTLQLGVLTTALLLPPPFYRCEGRHTGVKGLARGHRADGEQLDSKPDSPTRLGLFSNLNPSWSDGTLPLRVS